MKPISIIAITSLVAAILACGGNSDEATTDEAATDEQPTEPVTAEVELATVDMTQPWSGMSLPVGSGQVVASDADMLLVAYQSASIAGLTSDYSGSLTGNGWTESENYSTPDFTAVVYTNGEKKVGLAVGEESGLTFTYMEDLNKVTDSTVEAAKTGKHHIKSAGRFGKGGVKGGARHGTNRSGQGSAKTRGSKPRSGQATGGTSGGSRNKKKRH